MKLNEAPEAEERSRAIKLVELRAEELYRALLPHSRDLAAGVLSALLSAAEQLRERCILGKQKTNLLAMTDATLGEEGAAIYLRLHRGEPPLLQDSPALQDGELGQLLRALREAERAQQEEALFVVAALPVYLEQWLAGAADQALATASAEERQLWQGRAPIEVAAELLVAGLRRILREVYDASGPSKG